MASSKWRPIFDRVGQTFFILSCKSPSILGFLGAFLSILSLGNDDFQHHRLTFRDKRALTARQFAKEGQFHSLHCRLDSSQGMAANQDLVCGEDQPQLLLFPSALEFSKSELIERQQQALFS